MELYTSTTLKHVWNEGDVSYIYSIKSQIQGLHRRIQRFLFTLVRTLVNFVLIHVKSRKKILTQDQCNLAISNAI